MAGVGIGLHKYPNERPLLKARISIPNPQILRIMYLATFDPHVESVPNESMELYDMCMGLTWGTMVP